MEFGAEEIIVVRIDGSAEKVKNDSSFGKEWQEKKKTFEEKYFIPNGIAKIISFNYVEGLRIMTENKEVVHLRESSNAPEMRCYAAADSNARAVELVHIVLTKVVPELRTDLG